MKREKRKSRIAHAFLKWLLVLTLIAFIVTTVFLWFFQTRLANDNADNILHLNINDVKADIRDAADEHLLDVCRLIAKEMDGISADTTAREELNAMIDQLLVRYDAVEINVVNSQGVIVASNYEPFWDYHMGSGAQSAEFLVMFRGAMYYVQEYQPVSYDASIQRKYAAVRLANGGFVQVGYDFEHFQKSVDEEVISLTRNRHVGNNGRILIVDAQGEIVSNLKGVNREKLDLASFGLKPGSIQLGQRFTVAVDGVNFYGMAEMSEGYYIIAIIPEQEIVATRNTVVGVAVAAEMVIFAVLAALIYLLIKRQIVDNVEKINGSLSRITGGDLDVVVDVRNNLEFDALSNDINATVATLKKYIADAQARIDAELALAKAIQHSALPSVFPPYPNRKEFEIYATMHTARKVGGDFYDFYFVDENHLAFLAADVSGKGIPAAMFMMQSKTVLKSLTESGMSVEQVFTQANEKLCQSNDAGMFVTAWMGILDVRTGLVTFTNAGHNPPLVKHGDGTFEYLKTRSGFVLAGMEGIRYRKNELQLQPGDAIYLYTDGVTEATDLSNQLYGEARLHGTMERLRDAAAQVICEEVKKDVDAFVGEASQFDDISMLALRFYGAEVEQ